MGLPVKKSDGNPEEKFTYADYLTWPDDERWELIDGKPYALDFSNEKGMSPAPARMHQFIIVKLVTAFENFLSNKPCEVYVSPFDVRFPKGIEEDVVVDTVVQPDLAIICDEKKLDDRGCKGAPDLIIEILSPKTALKDKREKYELYQRHGVREYWLVYPGELLIEVFELQKDGFFTRKEVYSAEDTVEVGIFPDLKIELSPVFGIKKQITEHKSDTGGTSRENSDKVREEQL